MVIGLCTAKKCLFLAKGTIGIQLGYKQRKVRLLVPCVGFGTIAYGIFCRRIYYLLPKKRSPKIRLISI